VYADASFVDAKLKAVFAVHVIEGRNVKRFWCACVPFTSVGVWLLKMVKAIEVTLAKRVVDFCNDGAQDVCAIESEEKANGIENITERTW
jgi:hypothetical protein